MLAVLFEVPLLPFALFLKLVVLSTKMVTKRNYPNYLVDKKDGNVNKGILDIHVIDVYFTSVYSNPSVF